MKKILKRIENSKPMQKFMEILNKKYAMNEMSQIMTYFKNARTNTTKRGTTMKTSLAPKRKFKFYNKNITR